VGQTRVRQPARQAEVGNPDISLRVDQQVGGLDVAVDHALVMRVLQRIGLRPMAATHPT
jgi:hypothetical protein